MTDWRWLTLCMILACGCGTRVNNSAKTSTGPVTRGDPWPAAAAELARQPDAITARRILNQINADLDAANQPLPKISPDDLKSLTAKLRPSPEELRDWESAHFTPMDAIYLGECLYFAAVAQSLDVESLPAPAKAQAAFDWVCRQMYLRPWLYQTPRGPILMPPMPPQLALRRGYGTGIERGMAFLALARQLGLEPVLIGPRGSDDKRRWDFKPNATQGRGPFWAVGIRDAADTLLFDPWAGLPIRDGQAIARLNAAKANPAPIVNWFTVHSAPEPVKAEDVTAAEAFFTAPFSAFTPRIRLLESKFSETAVKLAATPPGESIPWYGPAIDVDPFADTRALAMGTPKDEGGFNPAPPQEQFTFLLAMVEPFSDGQFALPPELPAAARERFLLVAKSFYKTKLLDLNIPERIQRGQFNEAIRLLIDVERQCARLSEQLRSDPGVTRPIAEWYSRAAEAYDQRRLANLPENRARLPDADAAVNALWEGSAPINIAAYGAAADAARPDIAYLLALAKHEQAERAQTRAIRGGAPDKAAPDWAVARDAWARYQDAARKTDTIRNTHAQALAARAANPTGALR